MSEAFGISIYDGQAMAELGNVVVVTINCACPPLASSGPGGS